MPRLDNLLYLNVCSDAAAMAGNATWTGYGGFAAGGAISMLSFLDVEGSSFEYKMEMLLGGAFVGSYVYNKIEENSRYAEVLNVGLAVAYNEPYVFWGGVAIIAAGLGIAVNLLLSAEIDMITSILPINIAAQGTVVMLVAAAGMVIEIDTFIWPVSAFWWAVTGAYGSGTAGDGSAGTNIMPRLIGHLAGGTCNGKPYVEGVECKDSQTPPLPPVGAQFMDSQRGIGPNAFHFWYLPVDFFWFLIAVPMSTVECIKACVDSKSALPVFLFPIYVCTRTWGEMTCVMLDCLCFERDIIVITHWVAETIRAVFEPHVQVPPLPGSAVHFINKFNGVLNEIWHHWI